MSSSPSSTRSGGAPAEPPPVTRAWLITPDAAAASPKKTCLRLLSLSNITRLAIHACKVDRETRRVRVVVQAPHGLGLRLEAYISLFLAPEFSTWVIEDATPSVDECALFSGRHIVLTPPELSGGPDSSGAAGDVLSVISSSSTPTGTIRAEQERDEALARAARAEAERDAGSAASATRIAALEEMLRRLQTT